MNMSFRSIDNPFHSTHLVKLESGQDGSVFRPSAIDREFGVACQKASMEGLEEVFCREASIISSAAHTELSAAIYNAQMEAIERISLAAWWAFDRPMKGKLGHGDCKDITEGILPKDGSFTVNIGFVQPACGTGYAAVSILKAKSDYPKIVLGGSYAADPKAAAEKAFLESVQSWVATNWLKENDVDNMPYWDSQELLNRAKIIGESDVIEIADEFAISTFTSYFDDKPMRVIDHNGHYIVGVDAQAPVNGLSYLMADLDRQPNENVKVFTQVNF